LEKLARVPQKGTFFVSEKNFRVENVFVEKIKKTNFPDGVG